MFFKALFLTTTCSAQFLAQGQFGMVVLPLTDIGNYLGATSPGELSWMAASYGSVASGVSEQRLMWCNVQINRWHVPRRIRSSRRSLVSLPMDLGPSS